VDAVLSLAMLLVAAAPVGIAAAWLARRGPGVMAAAFAPGAVANPGWPRGVQEEDDVAWSWERHPDPIAASASGGLDGGDVSFETTAVAVQMRAGLARRRSNRRRD
jgi:hypothetical protein